MTKEKILEELTLYWQKLKFFFDKMVSMIQNVIADPNAVERGDLVMMLMTAFIVVAFFVGETIRFLKVGWKEKLNMLVTTVLVVVIVAIILFFVLRLIPIPALSAALRMGS